MTPLSQKKKKRSGGEIDPTGKVPPTPQTDEVPATVFKKSVKLQKKIQDRRGLIASELHELRLNIGAGNRNDEVKHELKSLEDEATREKLYYPTNYYFFSEDEIELTNKETQNCLDIQNQDINQYISDLEWFSKNNTIITPVVRRKIRSSLQKLCPAKAKTLGKDENELQKNIDKCTDNLVIKNPKISRQTAMDLCSTLNGILATPDKRNIPEKFDNILHSWFLENSIIEEIFKTLRSNELCFLHPILYSDDRKTFVIRTHEGRTENSGLFDLDIIKYYEDEIKNCNSKLIAIPNNIFSGKKKFGHATIIIIDRTNEIDSKTGKKRIIIEHFDSSNFTNYNDKDFEVAIVKFITSMFGDQFVYEFIGQMEVCPYNIQGRLSGTKYHGTCTQFQLWYAFKRLLEPHKPRDQVIEEMDIFLDKGVDGMVELIKTFQKLVDIKFDFSDDKFTGKVNNRNFVHTLEIDERPVLGGKKRTKRHLRQGLKLSQRKLIRKSLRKRH